jgi:uncharacterized protein YbjT (DUF2867 family)
MLKHWLIELVGHVSGLSDAQLRQIETSLPATKALFDTGTKRFVHLSGIGADPGSPSPIPESKGHPYQQRSQSCAIATLPAPECS